MLNLRIVIFRKVPASVAMRFPVYVADRMSTPSVNAAVIVKLLPEPEEGLHVAEGIK